MTFRTDYIFVNPQNASEISAADPSDGPSLDAVLDSYVRGVSVPVPAFARDETRLPRPPGAPKMNWWGDFTPRSKRSSTLPCAVMPELDNALGRLLTLASTIATREPDSRQGEFTRMIREMTGKLERQLLDVAPPSLEEPAPLSIHDRMTMAPPWGEPSTLPTTDESNDELRTIQNDIITVLVDDLKKNVAGISDGLRATLGELERWSAGQTSSYCKIFATIANLLDIADGERGLLVPRREEVKVDGEYERITRNYEARATYAGVRFLRCLDVGTVFADSNLLRRALENIVDFAIARSPRGATIVMSARSRDEDELTISVKGMHVSAVSREDLLRKRLGSVDANDNSQVALQFCRLAIEAHGGRIRIDEDAKSTTSFRMSLPRRSKTIQPNAIVGRPIIVLENAA